MREGYEYLTVVQQCIVLSQKKIQMWTYFLQKISDLYVVFVISCVISSSWSVTTIFSYFLLYFLKLHINQCRKKLAAQRQHKQ